MTRTQISAFALLVIALFMFVACDDEPDSEPAPAAPLSDLEWTRTWYDVEPVGSPVFDEGSDQIVVPMRGVFDLVKIDHDGNELWRQSENRNFICAGSNYIPGFYAVSRSDDGDPTWLAHYSSTGEEGDFIFLDSLAPSAVVRQSSSNPTLLVGLRDNENSKDRVVSAAVSSELEIENYAYYNDPGEHNDYVYGALALSVGGCISFGDRSVQPDLEVLEQKPLLMRFDENGNRVWTQTYDVTGRGVFFAVAEDPETGGYYCAGLSLVNGASQQALLMKIDASGAMLWRREWQFELDNSIATGVIVTAYGDIMVAGNGTLNDLLYDDRPFIVEFSSDGEMTSSKQIEGAPVYTREPSLAMDRNGGIFLYGKAASGSGFSLSKVRYPEILVHPDN